MVRAPVFDHDLRLALAVEQAVHITPHQPLHDASIPPTASKCRHFSGADRCESWHGVPQPVPQQSVLLAVVAAPSFSII